MEFVIKLHHSRYNCVYTTRRNEGETQFRAVCDNAAKRNIVPSTSQCHHLYISYVYALITVVMNLFWDLEFKQAFLRTTYTFGPLPVCLGLLNAHFLLFIYFISHIVLKGKFNHFLFTIINFGIIMFRNNTDVHTAFFPSQISATCTPPKACLRGYTVYTCCLYVHVFMM